ncbi:hypothetical protein HZ994_12800 [Akkermansiaceae bacterium]|nr:hypothetical protein HZ994_12800 [Akkermansiaceae bacterium]
MKPYLIEIEKVLPNVTSALKCQAILASRDFLLLSASDLSKPHPSVSAIRMLARHLENLFLCGVDPEGLLAGKTLPDKIIVSMIPVPCIFDEGGAR